MQLAVLESEFSPERLSRKLTEEGFSARLSQTTSGRVLVVVAPTSVSVLADAVTRFVLSDWLSDYVDQRLTREHPYLSSEDQEYVRLLTCHAFRTDPDAAFDGNLSKWREKIEDTIKSVLNRSGTVNVRGVLRFRVSEFLKSVDYAITDVVEHFLADKEYEEFVSMLRVMLDAQPPSTQTLHVYCTDERVWICDESGGLIKDQDITSAAEQASENGAVDAEDLAMSILIMRSPCAIIIHDITQAAAWPSFAETIERVFLDRVTHCHACSTCEKLRHTT